MSYSHHQIHFSSWHQPQTTQNPLIKNINTASTSIPNSIYIILEALMKTIRMHVSHVMHKNIEFVIVLNLTLSMNKEIICEHS
jgi:hypothetical protein